MKGLSLTGMMPALLRYIELYERRQSSINNKNNNNSDNRKTVSSAVTDKDKGVSSSSSIVTKPNTTSSSMHKEKEKEKGGVLVACVSGSTGKRETNYAVNCLLELFERSQRRPIPDCGVPLPPPPLLLQTLLWLLIRCEDGEKELVRVLQPYCEKAMKEGSQEDRERERDGVSAALSLTLSRSSSTPDLDLDFLLRECHR
jgi:hypothetical protein